MELPKIVKMVKWALGQYGPTKMVEGEILLETADDAYVQTWIVSVRPTKRACEVAGPGTGGQ